MVQSSPKLGDLDSNFKQTCETIEQAIEEKSDIVVFPELSLTGYLLKDIVPHVGIGVDDPKIKHLAGLSKDISILLGLVEEGGNRFYYNSAFYFENGELTFRHRKSYLATYGMFDEGRYFAAGHRMQAFDSRFGRIGVMICEDAWHAINPYILSQDGAQIMFIISNSPVRGLTSRDADFRNVTNWKQIIECYALLYSSFTVYVNRVGCEDGISFSGTSAVIDPYGRRITELPFVEQECRTVELDINELTRARVCSPILRDEKFLQSFNELERIRRHNYNA